RLRASVPEDQPTRDGLLDLRVGQPLVGAIVPLRQVGVDDGPLAQTGQLAGLPRPSQRADQDERETSPRQARPQLLGQSTPVIGERDVRRAGVPPAQAPLGLAMSDRINTHAAVLWLIRCRIRSSEASRRWAPAPTASR